jgi:hypothetical protein
MDMEKSHQENKAKLNLSPQNTHTDTKKLFNAKGYTINEQAKIKEKNNQIVGDYMNSNQKNRACDTADLIASADAECQWDVDASSQA